MDANTAEETHPLDVIPKMQSEIDDLNKSYVALIDRMASLESRQIEISNMLEKRNELPQ